MKSTGSALPARPTVLILIKGLGIGGAENLLVNSIPHLDRERFSYHIAYMLPWKDDLVGPFLDGGIPVHQIGGRRGRLLPAISDLRRLIQDHGIDLVDAHLPVPGVAARFATRLGPRIPTVYHEHSLSVQRRLGHLRFLAFAANVATYSLADVIVAVSDDTSRDIRRFNVSRTPVRTIINGIPLPRQPSARQREEALTALGIPEGHAVVGTVAKMVSKKQQSDLLRAAVLVLRERPQTAFVLVGQGPLRASLEAMADSLGIADSVFFPGFVDDLIPLVAGFDVFALSSLHEGLPTVLIEATSLGVPVVATRIGGTPEIIEDGVNGILVPPRDPARLGEAILRLLGDDALRRTMAGVGAVRARRFDIGRRVEQIEAVYGEVLHQEGVRHG